jgi:hypothetical protein
MNIGAHKSKVTFFFFEAKLRGINPKGLKTTASPYMEILNKILYYFFIYLKKPLFYLSKVLIGGVFIGIITGIIVSYLFTIPTISLTGTAVKELSDKNESRIAFENSGSAQAKNVLINLFYGYDGAEPRTFRRIQPKMVELIDAGDVFSYKIESLPKSTDQKKVILLLLITYQDSSRMRQLVNKSLLGNDYKMIKWMMHTIGNNSFSAVTGLGKEKYKAELLKRIEQNAGL